MAPCWGSVKIRSRMRPRNATPCVRVHCAVLTVERWPELREPVHGRRARRAGSTPGSPAPARSTCCASSCATPTTFATIDLTDLMDLQQTRPIARWADDGNRVIDWPEITFVAGRPRARRRARVRVPSRRCAGRRSRPRSSTPRARSACAQAYTLGGHARARVAPPAGPGARDRDAPFARAGARAAAPRLRRARPGCRRSCSARSATPTSRARACGRRCRSTCRARRRRPRCGRCSRGSPRSHRLDIDLRALDARSEAYLRAGRGRTRGAARRARRSSTASTASRRRRPTISSPRSSSSCARSPTTMNLTARFGGPSVREPRERHARPRSAA